MAKRPRPVARTLAVHWRLRTLMLERGVSDAVQLHKLLQPLQFKMTVSQVRRLVATQPVSFRADFLGAVCEVLHASLTDVLVLVPMTAQPAQEPEGRTTASVTDANVARLLGPAMPALPKGKFSARQ